MFTEFLLDPRRYTDQIPAKGLAPKGKRENLEKSRLFPPPIRSFKPRGKRSTNTVSPPPPLPLRSQFHLELGESPDLTKLLPCLPSKYQNSRLPLQRSDRARLPRLRRVRVFQSPKLVCPTATGAGRLQQAAALRQPLQLAKGTLAACDLISTVNTC